MGLRRPAPRRVDRRAGDGGHDVLSVFRKLYAARFPIRRLRSSSRPTRAVTMPRWPPTPPASIAASCRAAGGGRSLRLGDRHQPAREPVRARGPRRRSAGRRYLRRSDVRLRSRPGHVVNRAFGAIGWRGGRRSSPDYQHFGDGHEGPRLEAAQRLIPLAGEAVDLGQLVVAQLEQVEGGDVRLEPGDAARADERRGDAWIAERPASANCARVRPRRRQSRSGHGSSPASRR